MPTTDAPPSASAAPEPHRRLLNLIHAEIAAAGGCLGFDRFMELALHAPGLGYYSSGRASFGRAGDFVTAPELTPLYGQCLAAQAAEVLDALAGGEILEFGAGSGALAASLLAALAAAGCLPDRYLILEPSAALAERQRHLLAAEVPECLARVVWIQQLPTAFRGLMLANEVLDAMPVSRFAIGAAGDIGEICVTADSNGMLSERIADPRTPGLVAAVAALQAEGLADTPGYCSEINLRLAPWIRALAEALVEGLILIVDYGYPRAEYYHPERSDGTLLCYRQHQAHANPYLDLGAQDITAQVDFTAVAEAGRAAGLHLAGYTTQANFLFGCGLDALAGACLEAAPDTGTRLAIAAAVKQLILPAAMGERFQFIALARGLAHDWRGFRLRDLRARL